MGEKHQMAMPIALGRAELAETAAGIAAGLERPATPLPSAGEFPDPVVAPDGQVTTEEAVALGEAYADRIVAQRGTGGRGRPKFTADKVAVFARVATVRDQNGLVQFAPVTRVKVRGGTFWLMVPRQTLERCGFYVPGSPSPSQCVHPLVKGAGLMVRFTKNRIVLDMSPATTDQAKAAPAHDGGGHV
jgi:hypothetical protein